MTERRGVLPAQDKLLLLLSLVPYLIDHERVSVSEAAAHFGVSAAELRGAVRLIAVSGVPGQSGQYLPGDLFDIAWDDFEDNDRIVLTNLVGIDEAPRFSAREAAALIAGLQYIQSLPDNAGHHTLGALMAKLTRSAAGTPNPVAIAHTEADSNVALVRDAVTAGTQLEFDYQSARGDRQRRRVDPLRLESVDSDWYLRAWCHLRRAVRTFRLDRMSTIEATTEPNAFRPDEVDLPERLFEASDQDLIVDIDVAESYLTLVADYLEPEAPTDAVDGIVHTSIRVAHYHGLKRFAARSAGQLRVTGPQDAREAVAEWVRAALDRN